jgi:FkbM family methyltransferase
MPNSTTTSEQTAVAMLWRMRWVLLLFPISLNVASRGVVTGQSYAEVTDYSIFNQYLPHPSVPKTKLHVLDVGAHDTSWARSLQNYLTNYEVEFFQIEGNRDHAHHLESFGHMYCLSLVGDLDEEIVQFHKSNYPDFTTGNSIYREISNIYEHDTIETRTMYRLDTILAASSSDELLFDLVKYDVQGAEKKALLGSEGTLRKIQSGIVIIESALLPVNGGAAASLLDIQLVMHSFGFQLVDVLSEHYLVTTTGFQFVQVDAVYRKRNQSEYVVGEVYSWPPTPGDSR